MLIIEHVKKYDLIKSWMQIHVLLHKTIIIHIQWLKIFDAIINNILFAGHMLTKQINY